MTRSRIDPILVRTLWIGLGAAVVCTGCLPSCQFKDPFFANVTVTTVDGKLVRAATFLKNTPLSQATGGAASSSGGTGAAEPTISLDTLYGNQGRVTFRPPFGGPDVTSVSLAPVQMALNNVGPVEFKHPTLQASAELAIVVWYDANQNGRLDLSTTGPSEVARTISKDDAFLTYYNYDKATDTYTATGVTPSIVNRIVVEGDNRGWQALLALDTEDPVGASSGFPSSSSSGFPSSSSAASSSSSGFPVSSSSSSSTGGVSSSVGGSGGSGSGGAMTSSSATIGSGSSSGQPTTSSSASTGSGGFSGATSLSGSTGSGGFSSSAATSTAGSSSSLGNSSSAVMGSSSVGGSSSSSGGSGSGSSSGAMALLYTNSFEDGPADGQPYPTTGAGTGSLVNDVDTLAAFYTGGFVHVMTTYGDGTRGIRFNTSNERFGGSNYSFFPAQMFFRGAFVAIPHQLFTFQLALPVLYSHEMPSSYWEHRDVFSAWNMASTKLFAIQYTSDTSVCLMLAGSQVDCLTIPRGAGGSRHTVTLEVEQGANPGLRFSYDGVMGNRVAWTVDPTFTHMVVASAGNALSSDTNTDYFSSLDHVTVQQLP